MHTHTKAPEKKKSKSAIKRERKELKGKGGGGVTAAAVTVLSKCAACNLPWDRYIGKRKCLTCEVTYIVVVVVVIAVVIVVIVVGVVVVVVCNAYRVCCFSSCIVIPNRLAIVPPLNLTFPYPPRPFGCLQVPVLVCESCCTRGVGKAAKPSKTDTPDSDQRHTVATTTHAQPSSGDVTGTGDATGDATASMSTGGVNGKNNKDKTKDLPKPFSGLLRCTLCVKEGCTVAARALTLTDNGRKVNTNIGIRAGDGDGGGGGGNKRGNGGKPVAASTVCVWGGGGGVKKRERSERRGFVDNGDKRSKSDYGDSAGGVGNPADIGNTSRFAAMPCKFGTDCKRMGCWFSHPGRE